MIVMKAFKPPNGNVGIDGMINVISHELAELSSNPLINVWYTGEDPTSPTEIADLCEGLCGEAFMGLEAVDLTLDKYLQTNLGPITMSMALGGGI